MLFDVVPLVTNKSPPLPCCRPLLPVPPFLPACCASSAVGTGLNFPFTLRRHGPDPEVTNAAIVTTRDAPQAKWVGHNRVLIGVFLVQTRLNVSECNCTR